MDAVYDGRGLDADHEALVAAFLADAETNRPEEYARACEAYPVVANRALVRRRLREVPLRRED